jgi:hypothetical protein
MCPYAELNRIGSRDYRSKGDRHNVRQRCQSPSHVCRLKRQCFQEQVAFKGLRMWLK